MGKEFIHWNIRGINDKLRRKDKVDKILSLLQNPKKTALINLQETHLLSSEDIPKKLLEYKHIFHIIPSFASPADRGAGILLLINKSEEIISNIELIKGRILIIGLKNSATNQNSTIISFYGKSSNNNNIWVDHFKKVENYIIDNNLQNIVWLGDFNFVTSPLDRNSHLLNPIDEGAREPWQKLENKLDISDSFRYLNPRRLIYTYTHTNKKSRSRIDRIYLSCNLLPRIEKIRYENSKFSDHKMMILQIMDDFATGDGFWIFNNSLLKNEDFLEIIRDELRTARRWMEFFEKKRIFGTMFNKLSRAKRYNMPWKNRSTEEWKRQN